MGTQAAVVTGPVIIQMDSGEEEYNLLAPNGDEGPVTDWGIPAILVSGNLTYLAYRDEDGDSDPDIGTAVCLLTPIATEETEVEFEDEDGNREEEEEEEEEEEGDGKDAA
jgi:hypothetical protein